MVNNFNQNETRSIWSRRSDITAIRKIRELTGELTGVMVELAGELTRVMVQLSGEWLLCGICSVGKTVTSSVLRRLTVPEAFYQGCFFLMSIRGFVGFSVIADLGVLDEFWTAVLAWRREQPPLRSCHKAPRTADSYVRECSTYRIGRVPRLIPIEAAVVRRAEMFLPIEPTHVPCKERSHNFLPEVFFDDPCLPPYPPLLISFEPVTLPRSCLGTDPCCLLVDATCNSFSFLPSTIFPRNSTSSTSVPLPSKHVSSSSSMSCKGLNLDGEIVNSFSPFTSPDAFTPFPLTHTSMVLESSLDVSDILLVFSSCEDAIGESSSRSFIRCSIAFPSLGIVSTASTIPVSSPPLILSSFTPISLLPSTSLPLPPPTVIPSRGIEA
ncbi:hypothetical protein HID58_066604 [Brassica napus]|uniref:Uncharacterized protein n=1 Tax=Brassica napus TaxID=3708 RepID=A0ABQ7ZG60_BRANA|nr:hypothetical protein HID58_066604 [Brassica napus]